MISQGEKKIISILRREGVMFQKEKTFQDLQHNGVHYRFDFYIPNVVGGPYVIELDGAQHWRTVWGGRKQLLHYQENDRKKNTYCLVNKIKLYRIPYWELDSINSLNDMIKDKYRVRDKWHNDKIKPPQSK